MWLYINGLIKFVVATWKSTLASQQYDKKIINKVKKGFDQAVFLIVILRTTCRRGLDKSEPRLL